jgi:NhaP-type Na+/H+ or K+/H+ antiporter
MIDTLITLAAITTGAPLAVLAATSPPHTPRSWYHHAALVLGLVLLVGGVAVATAGGMPGR